jgi:hypothetical protein
MPSKQDFAEAKSKMVRKLLSEAYDYFQVPLSTPGKKRWEVAMDHLDEWFIHGGHAPYNLRKPVRSMTYKDLVTANTIWQKVYQHFLKKL